MFKPEMLIIVCDDLSKVKVKVDLVWITSALSRELFQEQMKKATNLKILLNAKDRVFPRENQAL